MWVVTCESTFCSLQIFPTNLYKRMTGLENDCKVVFISMRVKYRERGLVSEQVDGY